MLAKRILEEMNEHEFPPMSAEDAAILANISINGEESSVSRESVGEPVHDAEPGRRSFLPAQSGETDSSTHSQSTGFAQKISNVLGRFVGKPSENVGFPTLNRTKL